LNNQALNNLLAKFGLDPVPVFEDPPMEVVYPVELAGDVTDRDRATIYRLSEEVGTPGTLVNDGMIQMETNPRYEPITVRGYIGDPGLFEQYGRSEPQILDALTSIQEVLIAGDRKIQPPTVMPPSLESKILEFCAWANTWLANINRSDGLTSGGFDSYIEHAATAAQFGFANFEVVWGRDRYNKLRPVKLAYREPATVDKWLLSYRQDHLRGCLFRTGGSEQLEYVLSATGPTVEDHKLINIAVLRRGNNFEGISLIRPVIHWIKVKELIGQMIPITSQKWGAPRERVMADPSFLSLVPGRGASEDDVRALVQVLGRLGYGDTTHNVPDGLKVETDYPGSSMPSFREVLDYCDTQIALPWNNEGSLLGQQSVGSYAMAAVSDNKFMRSAMYMNRKVSEPIDALLRLLARVYIGELPEYPYLGFRLDGVQDQSRWIDDAVKVFSAGVLSWPEEARAAAAEKLGLSPAAFDPAPAPAAQPTVNASCCAKHAGHPQRPVNMVEPPGRIIACAELSVEELEKLMDQTEAAMARRLNIVAQAHKRRFRALTDGVTDLAMIESARDLLRTEFKPQYEAVARETTTQLYKDVQKSTLGEFGYRIKGDAVLPESKVLAIEAMAQKIGEDTFNRESGLMRDERLNQLRGVPRVSVPTLAVTTLQRIAAEATSTVVNEARQSVVEEVVRRTAVEDPRITVVRSAVMDQNTCEPCNALDGARYVYGSDVYYQDMPPNWCDGERMCRCVYIYEVPEELRDGFQDLVDSL
jgi:hypothetical protein